MTFSWTPHRFSGGALALDVANSVVLRFDQQRRIDRFADTAAMDTFAEAASRLCGERQSFGTLTPTAPERRPLLLALRETTDQHFRAQADGEGSDILLADLLNAIAAALRGGQRQANGFIALEAAAAHSALRLVSETHDGRLKVCPNCQWLFIDRSRNRSRSWCDMAICGNRVKASRHYRKQKEAGP
ncbi:CGNR zinc finger domain-containing protein [Pararhizobium arenae]|uniref:CGNR zinc finger domain-containing protein n=1 Tax=Pararhizobium arenae TaxID=1856850 RepID=UPI00094B5AA9|nr:CGNR zinc finger domain-containing protein [Pararhizobium arenae]